MRQTLTFFCLFILTSCSQKFYLQDAISKSSMLQVQENENGQYSLDIKYSADAFHYIIFELDIVNQSSDSLYINGRDIFLSIGNIETGEELKIDLIEKEALKEELQDIHKGIQREKKAATTWGIVSAGLDILSIALTPGVNSFDALWFGAESAGFIMEERRQYELISGEISEQMIYVDEWVLGNETILPYEEVSFDLLFDRTLLDGVAELHMKCNEDHHQFDFDFFVVEEKR